MINLGFGFFLATKLNITPPVSFLSAYIFLFLCRSLFPFNLLCAYYYVDLRFHLSEILECLYVPGLLNLPSAHSFGFSRIRALQQCSSSSPVEHTVSSNLERAWIIIDFA